MTIVVVTVGALILPRDVTAGGRSAVDEITDLNRRATDEYENLNFDKARETLTAALQACERAGLTQHRLAAEAHLLMGVVLLAEGANRRNEAAGEFHRAVEIRPSIVVPERLANPEVQEAFAAATAAVRDSQGAVATSVGTARGAEDRDAVGSTKLKSETAADATATATADSDSDSDGVSDEASEAVRRPRSWFIGFGAGSGLGWTSGNGEVTDAPIQSGFHAAAMAHLLPEIGYFVRPNVLLSAQLRVQFVSGASSERDPSMTMCGSDHICSASKGATAGFAKAAWLLGDGRTFQPYLAGMLGFGQIRHVASVPGVSTCGTEVGHPTACTDTVAAGPVFLGPGGGVLIHIAPHFALVVGASTFFAMPRFAVHIDVDAGIALEL